VAVMTGRTIGIPGGFAGSGSAAGSGRARGDPEGVASVLLVSPLPYTAGHGRPGNIPTAAAWSSARYHASEHVAPSARIMFSPFEPVTTQTWPPPSTKNAVSPMRSPRPGRPAWIPPALPRAQQRPWRVGHDGRRFSGPSPGAPPVKPQPSRAWLAASAGAGRGGAPRLRVGAPVGCGSSLIRRGRRAGLASLPTPRGRARLH
jgi:hypothetical protein